MKKKTKGYVIIILMALAYFIVMAINIGLLGATIIMAGVTGLVFLIGYAVKLITDEK